MDAELNAAARQRHPSQVKAALRRVPSAQQRLVAATAACRFQESKTTSQVEASVARQQVVLGEGVDSRSVDAAAVAGARGPEVEVLRQRVHWLQQAGMQLAGLLEALQSAAPEPAEAALGAGAWAGARGWRAPMDRSPLRDQTGGLRM